MSRRVCVTELVKLASDILAGAGCEATIALEVAEALVAADLAGHTSHGTRYLGEYLKRIEAGVISGSARPEVVAATGATALVEGRRAFGQIVGAFSVRQGVALAKRFGVSAVSTRNSAHFGWNGRWPQMAADQGAMSVHFVNGTGALPVVAPFGAVDPRLPSNPIALGAPGPDGAHIVSDFATSAVAISAIRQAAEEGRRLSTATIFDTAGNLTDNPQAFVTSDSPAVVPFGGFKGYSLGLMADIFAGAIGGGGVQEGLESPLLANNMLSLFVDVSRFTPTEDYFARVEGLRRWVESATPAAGNAKVVLPGDRSRSRKAEAEKAGLVLQDEHVAILESAASDLGLETNIGCADMADGLPARKAAHRDDRS